MAFIRLTYFSWNFQGASYIFHYSKYLKNFRICCPWVGYRTDGFSCLNNNVFRNFPELFWAVEFHKSNMKYFQWVTKMNSFYTLYICLSPILTSCSCLVELITVKNSISAAIAMFDSYIEPTLSNLTMNDENTTYLSECESCIEIPLKIKYSFVWFFWLKSLNVGQTFPFGCNFKMNQHLCMMAQMIILL